MVGGTTASALPLKSTITRPSVSDSSIDAMGWVDSAGSGTHRNCAPPATHHLHRDTISCKTCGMGEEQLQELFVFFKALADENRLRIVGILARKEATGE